MGASRFSDISTQCKLWTLWGIPIPTKQLQEDVFETQVLDHIRNSFLVILLGKGMVL